MDSTQKCNSGKEGSLVYDLSKNSFFTCINENWIAINLQGVNGGAVRGILIQYAQDGGDQLALISLPNKDLIYVNVNSGKYSGRPWQVFYTSAACTGTAYAGRADSLGPHVIGRIYVGVNNQFNPISYFRAEAWYAQNIAYTSYREFNTYGQMGSCHDTAGSFTPLVRVVEIAAPDSLVDLAPIQFSN
ncbi:MAG: hypothetical protein WA160_16700 [Pseudobdellovibrio sp.]